MNMKVAIAGSTGMIGNLVQAICLDHEDITEVRSLVRKPTWTQHDKLTETVIEDFEDYSGHDEVFKDVGVGFFCIGAYTGQVPDDLFKKITLDYAVAFGRALEEQNPGATLCLLSGQGADRTEKSRTSFARYKGMAENQLSTLNLKFHSFRPAYIYPVTPRKEPNFMYRVSRFLYPLIKTFGKKYSIKSTELAQAMVNVGLKGADMEVLENQDILRYS
jgi:uncharacterized protein YbjT (DUF2867 family)